MIWTVAGECWKVSDHQFSGTSHKGQRNFFNPLNAELNPICHLLALLGSHPILHVSRIRVKRIRCIRGIKVNSSSYWKII